MFRKTYAFGLAAAVVLAGGVFAQAPAAFARALETGYQGSAYGTQFTGLSVAGVPVGGTQAPNTKITLPGVGYVVLNQQTSSIGAVSANMTVIGIHVVVTITTPLADAGTQIYVGYATSSLGGP